MLRWLTILSALFLFASSANAQLLEGDEGGLDDEPGAALEVRKKAPKKVLDDPDPKSLKATEDARTALEKRINGWQTKSQKFEKTQGEMGKITQAWLKAFDAYLGPHNEALEAYRAALAANKKEAAAKQAKAVAKARKKLNKAIVKINKRLAKLDKHYGKLAEKLAAEEAEDAAENALEE